MVSDGMGTATWVKALDNLDLLAAPVANELRRLAEHEPDLAGRAVVAGRSGGLRRPR